MGLFFVFWVSGMLCNYTTFLLLWLCFVNLSLVDSTNGALRFERGAEFWHWIAFSDRHNNLRFGENIHDFSFVFGVEFGKNVVEEENRVLLGTELHPFDFDFFQENHEAAELAARCGFIDAVALECDFDIFPMRSDGGDTELEVFFQVFFEEFLEVFFG